MDPTAHLWKLLRGDAERLARWQRACEVAYKATRPDRCKAHVEVARALHEALSSRAPSIPPGFYPESGTNPVDRVDCLRIADWLITDEVAARWDAAL